MADTAAVLKDQGNAAFKNNHLSAAIDLYSKALRKTDDNELKTTLLSNRAICYHKNKDYSKCIDDCKNALTLRPTHTKALFRLAAAYEANRDYADAHNALKRLFAVDSNNADGLKLMRTVKSKLIELQQENSSQVKRVLETACQDSTKLETGLKTLVGLCYDDKYNAFDLGSKGGWQFLHKVIEENMIDAVDDKKKADLVVAAVRVISASSNHKQFVERYVDVHGEVNGKIDLLWLSNLLSSRIPDVLGPAMVLVMTVLRMLPLSMPQQPSVNSGETENKESSNKTPLEPYLREHSARHILRNVKNALLCGDPENYSILSESLSAFLSDSVDYFAQEKEVDRRLETLEERKERFAIENVVARRAQQHCAWAINEGIFSVLVDHTDSENFRIRQSASACIGRLIHLYNNDEGMKAFLKPYLVGDENDTDNTLLDNNREEKQVVEILDTVPPPIADCRKRAALEAALLVSRPDLGAWTLTQTGAIKQLLLLVSTGDLRCQEIATEVMCLAASTESAASLLAPVVSSGALGNLMKSPSTAIRAAAASTMTKLSIKAKALTEDAAEVSHVLNTVLTVLKAASNISNTKEQNKDQNLVSFSSLDDVSRVSQTKNKEEIRKVSKQLAKEFESNSVTMTSVERAVEVLAAMVGKTYVKEELVHGSYRVASCVSELAKLDLDVKSTAAYGLAHIMAALTVTNRELRAKALAEKDMTVEQYEQMQELHRIKTKDEDGNVIEEKKEDTDPDTEDMCRRRIQKMVAAGVISLLVKFLTMGSNKTQEMTARTLRQIAVDESSRGLIIQQGALKACCTAASDGENYQKATRLEAAHAVGKTLITTNPNLLSEHARLAAIGPLLFACKESDSTELMQFEALMALTNLVSCGMPEKDRFAAERGVQAVHYLVFSDNMMVRRAAAEVFCNMSTHDALLKLLRRSDQLRLWLGLCEDWKNENNPEQAFLTARAASGTLAGAAGDEGVVDALVAEDVAKTLVILLESENIELVHRALVIASQMLSFEKVEVAKHLLNGSVVPAIAVVSKLNVPQLGGLATEIAQSLSEMLKNEKIESAEG